MEKSINFIQTFNLCTIKSRRLGLMEKSIDKHHKNIQYHWFVTVWPIPKHLNRFHKQEIYVLVMKE